jgi:hypothetical protein
LRSPWTVGRRSKRWRFLEPSSGVDASDFPGGDEGGASAVGIGIGRMSAVDVKVREGKAYLADLDNGLYILDVSDPKRPTALAHHHTPNAHAIDLGGNIALLGKPYMGYRLSTCLIHASSPCRPVP